MVSAGIGTCPDFDQLKSNTSHMTFNVRNVRIDRNKEINCIVSSIIMRKNQYSVKVEEINKLLQRELSTGINLITHENIPTHHLNQEGIDLSKRGMVHLH